MEANPNMRYASNDGTSSRILQDLHLRKVYSDDNTRSDDMLRTGMKSKLKSKSKQISVGIVGAGFAGLRCADVLLRHGAKVTIFEARDRLGGRVGQSWKLGKAVDL